MHQPDKKNKASCKDSFEASLNYLKIRDHSRFELELKLKKKGFSSSQIKEAIHKCLEYKFIDDEKFAKNYFEVEKRKLNGPLKIKADFYKKGIAAEISDRLISDFEGSQEEYDLALKYFLKSKYKIDKKDSFNKKAQAYMRIMSQKGFSKSVVIDIFEQHLKDEQYF
ncbi:MAG: regulatory protein RecX [Desulforegulaceae bacterium]|nr:regulatory protein RecX [Desulforegulaceae bacterium]